MSKTFPVLWAPASMHAVYAHVNCPKTIPWDIIEPHREQAFGNHHQSLERLAARGGLNPYELLAVLLDKPWNDVSMFRLEFVVSHIHARVTAAALQKEREVMSDEPMDSATLLARGYEDTPKPEFRWLVKKLDAHGVRTKKKILQQKFHRHLIGNMGATYIVWHEVPCVEEETT